MVDKQGAWSTGRTSSVGGGVAAGGTDPVPSVSSVGDYSPPAVNPVAQAAGGVAAAAGQVAQQTKDAAAPITDQVQQTAGQVAEQAKQQAMTQIGSQKEHAAGSLDAVALALRHSGDQLRSNQQEPLANLAATAAQHVEQFSGYLRNTDVSEMIQDVELFARRQPAAFIGGAFTLGVLAARFLKSSSQQANSTNAGRRPTYAGYAANPYVTSGMSRYPAPMPPTYPGSLGSSQATPSTRSSDFDLATGVPSGSATAVSGTGLEGAIRERTLDRSGITATPTPPSGPSAASGWGYTPRTTGTDREGR